MAYSLKPLCNYDYLKKKSNYMKKKGTNIHFDNKHAIYMARPTHIYIIAVPFPLHSSFLSFFLFSNRKMIVQSKTLAGKNMNIE